MKICIATENKGKLEELLSLLSDVPADFITARQLGYELNAEETGSSYAENAHIKAELYSKTTGLLTLADDTGLEVQALHGAPGLFSARYLSDPNATDADRRHFLISQLEAHPSPWKARFTCTICLFQPDGQLWYTSGDCMGEIIPEERGENGFGYDQIFLVKDARKTMAELNLTEKNEISHRARAVRAAIPILERLIRSQR
jgi:XTP/dITP diphosphohydrolase